MTVSDFFRVSTLRLTWTVQTLATSKREQGLPLPPSRFPLAGTSRRLRRGGDTHPPHRGCGDPERGTGPRAGLPRPREAETRPGGGGWGGRSPRKLPAEGCCPGEGGGGGRAGACLLSHQGDCAQTADLFFFILFFIVSLHFSRRRG